MTSSWHHNNYSESSSADTSDCWMKITLLDQNSVFSFKLFLYRWSYHLKVLNPNTETENKRSLTVLLKWRKVLFVKNESNHSEDDNSNQQTNDDWEDQVWFIWVLNKHLWVKQVTGTKIIIVFIDTGCFKAVVNFYIHPVYLNRISVNVNFFSLGAFF